uniref:Ig-like domain-containing protein n=1 Tax=Terrapene triunguis TaxID=2587831 RepID=A0A674J7T6_9SAUR
MQIIVVDEGPDSASPLPAPHPARPSWGDCAGVCLTTCLLLTAEPSYPKPSISLRPSGRVALGGAVTVRCRGRYQNMKFLLYKDGNPNALQDMEPAGDLAEFPIRNVSWRDAGSYSCYYHHKWYPFIWSRPSDPVELVVAGELPGSVSPLPAPHPAGPSGQGHVQGRKQAQGPSNQWVQSTEFLRGAEPFGVQGLPSQHRPQC